MFDRFVLWWCRTWVLWCLVLGLVFITAPIKAYQVSFEAVTSDGFWAALATDLDVGATVREQADQVMDLVPVDELKTLEPMLGEERTQEIVGEAQQIRDGVAEEVGAATSRSVNKVVGESVPRFLMGEDFTGNQLSEDLMLDLRPVRSDLEAWLTKAGRLIVDAVAEAVQTEIKAFMAPAISELASGQELMGLQTRLTALEESFTLVAETMRGVGGMVSTMETLGILDDKESTDAALRLTATVEQLAVMGVGAVQQGRDVLSEATVDGAVPDWGMVVDQVTAAMLEDAVRSAKDQADVFAKDLTQAIVGNGTYSLPSTVRRVMVEQLRPAQLVLAPTVTAGAALNAVLLAGLWALVLLAVLVAGRTQRAAFWLGGAGLMVGAMSAAIAATVGKMALAFAQGLGAMGQAVAEAGTFIARMLSWCWSVLRYVLDIEDTEFHAIEGWTTHDVINSATYGLLQRDVIDRLDGWGDTVMQLSCLALLTWIALQVAQRIMRSRPAASPGTLAAVLQQPGGMRIEDPLLFLVPRRGTPVESAGPHAAPSRLLSRGVIIDLSWLLLVCLLSFSGIGLCLLIVLGPAGGGAAVVTSSAIITGLMVVPCFIGLRLWGSGGRTFAGALAGEVLIDHTGDSQPWRLRSLLAILPWVGAMCVGLLIVCLTDSAMLGVGTSLGLLLLAELCCAVLSGGSQTLGAKLMDRRSTVAGAQITDEHRIRTITMLSHAGSVWSILWGFFWFGFFGLGFYALVTGIAGAVFWYQGRNGPPSALRVRGNAFLRIGNWLSLDLLGMGIGIATLWLLQNETARAHFSSNLLPDAAFSAQEE